jgi:hypothetical protein
VNRFQFVADHQTRYGVKRLCTVLGIARSSFYYWRATAPDRAARDAADGVLAVRIRAVQKVNDGTYGAPRVTAELNDAGLVVNHKKVARVMRRHRIASLSRFLCKSISLSRSVRGSVVVSGAGLDGGSRVFVLQAEQGQAEHVDQPAWSAGDVVPAQDRVELGVGARAGVAEVVLADMQEFPQLLVLGVGGHHGGPYR